MKLKRIRKIRINCLVFNVVWSNKFSGGSFDYGTKKIYFGTKRKNEEEIFESIVHELMELVAVENHTRLRRPDCDSDYIFIYDHRQHSTMMLALAGLLCQFIK